MFSFDDCRARFEQSSPFGVFDHPNRHAVLDRIPRIEGFDLRHHRRLDEVFGDGVDPDHRRMANGVEDGLADLFHAHECISQG